MSAMNSLNYCPNCGTKIISDAKFCSECGYQIEKLRQLINEAQNQSTDNLSDENNNVNIQQTYHPEDNHDYQENNNNQLPSEDQDIFENNQVIQEEKPENDSINDIELVRPKYKENNIITQDYNQDDCVETETIQIQVEDDDFNDFDIIRPNSQNNKKRPKDFRILNLNNKNH